MASKNLKKSYLILDKNRRFKKKLLRGQTMYIVSCKQIPQQGRYLCFSLFSFTLISPRKS